MLRKRSHYAGTLNASHIGSTVTLNGWVATRRDLGGLIFVDVRDHVGIAQAVFAPQHAPQLMELASELRNEFVVSITGEVRHRERPNPGLATGEVEVYATELEILNRADPTPFEVGNRAAASEELRLKYRYLDMRDQDLQRILRMRSRVYGITRRYFAENDFVEVETPIMVRATPEGARDYLVPSRVHPGHFYALPQSPQIYKQLLMVGGFDRYVQIARCMRDEDLRADRQPEFTQIDLEMSFVEQEDVLRIVEGYFAAVWREIRGVELALPLPRMSYREAMERFGSDKPDTRFGMELVSVGDLLRETEFSVFRNALDSGGAIAGITFAGGAHYSRKHIDELTEHVKRYRAKGLVWLKATADDLEGGSAKFLTDVERRALRTRMGASEGDMLLFVADKWNTAYTALGQLRLEIARRDSLIPKDRDSLLFITDFPMFEPELDATTGLPIPAHHPFTSVKPEDAHLLKTDPLKARANCYDPVINGYEIGSGSIRIHDRATQREIFKLIGLSDEEAQRKFGFLLEAFRYGAPPHGGVALGLDRIIMILAGTENIRDVIAYPKTASAASLMDEAPSEADADALQALHIRVVE